MVNLVGPSDTIVICDIGYFGEYAAGSSCQSPPGSLESIRCVDFGKEGEQRMERSFVMVKPDGVQRGLIGEVISRFERRGLKLAAAKFTTVSRELAEQHYAELKERPFFPGLIQFITSGPVMAMVWEGPNAIATIRKSMGATNPANAEPGTIRADLACDVSNNIVHGSDGPENAAREIGLWFGEVGAGYTRAIETWVYPTR